MTLALYSAAIAKEGRALLPVWVVSGLVLTADAIFGPMRIVPVGPLAYAIGAVALGAQSMGHEYACGTLGTFLAQPGDRRRMLLIKESVLAVMLFSLLAIAAATLLNATDGRASVKDQTILIFTPTLCGLFVAPWMTMITRNTLAGAVFSVSIPGTMLVIAELIGDAIFGAASTQVDIFRFELWSRGMLVFCATAAVLGWRKFLRLEVLDGTHRELSVPRRWTAQAAQSKPRHPFWMLAKKELHLQQLSFVVAIICAIGSTALVVGREWRPDGREILFAPGIALYVGLLSILIGSLASADERQLGMLEWHMLLPVPRWQQWAIKILVAFATAVVLTIGFGAGLTTALAWYFQGWRVVQSPPWWMFLPLVAFLTAASLYVSSMCRSGIRAIVLALPVGLGTLMFVQGVYATLTWVLLRPLLALRTPFLRAPGNLVPLLIEIGLIALLLWFAFLNHSTAERSARRIAMQLAALAAFATFGIALSFTQ